MAVPLSAERASSRLVGWLVGLLLASLVGGVFWPAFRDALAAGGSAVAVPLLRRAGAKVAPGPRAPSHLIGTPLPSDRLATLARRMEFRVRRYRVTPALMQTWMAEWGCGPAEKLQMLRLLLSARQVGAGGEPGNSDSEDLSAGGSDDGGDGDGGRHRLRQEDCTIS